jgi:hypothetical protein
MSQYTIDATAEFTKALEPFIKDLPQFGAAIELAKKLIQAKPLESGFVIGKDGWHYFTTETSPCLIVYYYVDEHKKAIWLMKVEPWGESE